MFSISCQFSVKMKIWFALKIWWCVYFLPISHVFNFVLVQLNMLEEGLINHPAVGFGESGRKASELRILLAKIEESEVCIHCPKWIYILL